MKKPDHQIKKELESVYIVSDGRKFLKYMDALYAESELQSGIKNKLSKEKKIMDTIELIMRILESQNWGIYYRNQPIQPLETQDGSALYKVNQVDDSEIEKVIKQSLTEGEPCTQTFQTQEYSQTDSSPKKNSETG